MFQPNRWTHSRRMQDAVPAAKAEPGKGDQPDKEQEFWEKKNCR